MEASMESYGRRLSESSVFGQILALNSVSGTVVFIAVLVFFLLFEAVLHVFEVACNKRGFKGLVKKLYREFMIMGLISFAFYIASEAYDFPTSEWFLAFDFAHIVILFIGITFLLQSALLVTLVSSRNLTLLRYANSTSEDLILEYVALYKSGGLRFFLFENGPVSIPFPELREKIEYKILQQFFIKVYNLPHEFKFANYMCMILKNYVIALVEVRPVSWLIISCFVALNYLKISIIDPVYQSDVCKKYPSKSAVESHSIIFSHAGSSAATDGETSNICDEYTLRYTCFVLLLIGLFLIGVLIASEVYMNRLIDIVLDQQANLGITSNMNSFDLTNAGDIEMGAISHDNPMAMKRKSSHNAIDDSEMQHNRRSRYLDGLEKMMGVEYSHHMDLARRMSASEPETPTLTESTTPFGSDRKGSFMGFSFGSGGKEQSIRRGSFSSVNGEDEYAARPPTGDELRAKFQKMQTIGKELNDMRQAEQQQVTSNHGRMRAFTAAMSPAPSSGRARSNTKFFTLNARDRQDSAQDGKHNSRGGHRQRGYSVDFFDTSAIPAKNEAPTTFCGHVLNAFKHFCTVLHKAAKKFGSMLIEHHIGHSKTDLDTDEDIKHLQKQFNQIFLFAQPEFYYHSVEMALLMQCVYIALWATNFVQMAQHSHYPVRWHILLVFPLPLNFFILKQIIFTSCMLKSILSLDKHVSDKICEDAVDEQNVTQRLRKLIRNEIKKSAPELDKEGAKVYLYEKFSVYVVADHSEHEGVTERQLKLFLHSLQIFLTDVSISRIFAVIDFDKDGIVTWDNLCPIIFPDLQSKKVKVTKRTSVYNAKRYSFDIERYEPLKAFQASLNVNQEGPPDNTAVGLPLISLDPHNASEENQNGVHEDVDDHHSVLSDCSSDLEADMWTAAHQHHRSLLNNGSMVSLSQLSDNEEKGGDGSTVGGVVGTRVSNQHNTTTGVHATSSTSVSSAAQLRKSEDFIDV